MARSSDQTNGQNSGGIPPLRGRISRSSRSAPHPGAFLESRFLEPLGISQAELAQAIGVSRRRINELIVRANARFQPTRRFAYPDTSIPIQNSGSLCKCAGTFIRRLRMRVQKRESARFIGGKAKKPIKKTILGGQLIHFLRSFT